MLQYPTNVYPQNVAFDCTVPDENNELKFIFNGDILTSLAYRIWDYETGEEVKYAHVVNQYRTPLCYNGDYFVGFINGVFGEDLEVGHEYIMQMMLTQSTTDGSELIYDMQVVNGSVLGHNTSTSFYIGKKIPNIYEWDTANVKTPTRYDNIAAARMKITIYLENNGETFAESRYIESYNYTTGEVIVNSAFTYPPLAGNRYAIHSNYLVTPQYYFMCRSTPTNPITITINDDGYHANSCAITATGNYYQLEGCMIKSWRMELYWYKQSADETSDAGWRLLQTTPEVYSQRIKWQFYDSLVGYNTIDKVQDLAHLYYRVKCFVTTQEGMEYITYAKIQVTTNNSESYIVPDNLVATILDANKPDYITEEERLNHHTVLLDLTLNTDLPDSSGDLTYDFYRRDCETGEVVHIQEEPRRINARRLKCHDYFVPCKGEFEYIFVPRQKTGQPYAHGIISTTIETEMQGYSITALIPHDDANYGMHPYDMHSFDIGECWKFVGEIQDTTVTQNIDRVSHVGHGKYNMVSSGVPNFSSGTISAMMGYVDCVGKHYVDTVDMVKAWRKFITQNYMFLLKSPKGDVWIVNITEAPTTTYAEDNVARPTTFTFSWAECCSADEIHLERNSIY